MTSSWYEIEEDGRGVSTTQFEFSSGLYRTGAAGTRLVQQLLDLGIPDGALREITEAAVAWVPFTPTSISDHFSPAHLRKEETGLVVEHFLRALGFQWDEAQELAIVYRPPSSSVADLSNHPLDIADWPPEDAADGASGPIAPEHRVALIRIPRAYRAGMSGEALYEATRKWWRTNPDRHPADYAFAVVGGKVLAVYRIHDWERQESSGRWAFRGELDPTLEERYGGTDVSGYFPPGAANPIRFINC